jgi:hypothetical protein
MYAARKLTLTPVKADAVDKRAVRERAVNFIVDIFLANYCISDIVSVSTYRVATVIGF